jgi:5-methylcytosine-specific restriction endonuclease McrA
MMSMQKHVDSFYKTQRWLALRRQVLKRDRYTCATCGAECWRAGEAIVDHIQPRKLRPDLAYDLDNLRVQCRTCDGQSHLERFSGGGERVERIQIRGCDADGLPIAADHPWRRK